MARELATAARRGPTSGAHPAVREPASPVLASEVLREEVAPIEPGRGSARGAMLGLALALGLLGLGLRLGLGVPGVRLDASTLSFSAAGAIAAVALLPFPYALRAGMSVLLGGALFALGLRGAGPLAGLEMDGGVLQDVARVVAVTLLPAALLFRARYRAYRRARVVLAVALLFSLPFVLLQGSLLLDADGPLLLRGAAAVTVVAVLTGLLGFMGEATTGGGSIWAALLLGVASIEIALRELSPLAGPDTGLCTYPATALGFFVAATLIGIGLFQLLAAGLAGDARRESGRGRAPDSAGK